MTREQIVREREALKAQFGSAYESLLGVLFEEDPEGLNFGVSSPKLTRLSNSHARWTANRVDRRRLAQNSRQSVGASRVPKL